MRYTSEEPSPQEIDAQRNRAISHYIQDLLMPSANYPIAMRAGNQIFRSANGMFLIEDIQGRRTTLSSPIPVSHPSIAAISLYYAPYHPKPAYRMSGVLQEHPPILQQAEVIITAYTKPSPHPTREGTLLTHTTQLHISPSGTFDRYDHTLHYPHHTKRPDYPTSQSFQPFTPSDAITILHTSYPDLFPLMLWEGVLLNTSPDALTPYQQMLASYKRGEGATIILEPHDNGEEIKAALSYLAKEMKKRIRWEPSEDPLLLHFRIA